jgi:flavin-dependent dehydrogenase
MVVPREQLDEWILAAARTAGVRIHENTAFKAYRTTASGVEVDVAGPDGERTLRGRVLIGADGSNSQVAKQLRGRIPSRDRIMAVRAYFEDVTGPPGRADLLFHTRTFPGYTWVFPTGVSSANVGVGMASDLFPKSEEHLRPLLLKLIESDRALVDRLGEANIVGRVKGFPLATYNPSAPVSAHRLLLVGDAAGLINPINGEGIQYALLSGRWAAETIVAAAATGFDPAALGAYRTRVRTELGADLALARLIVQIISNRDLNPVWLRVLDMVLRGARTDADYAELAGGILAGLQPTTTALGWGMLSRLAAQTAVEARTAAVAFGAEPFERSMALGIGAARLGFQLSHDAIAEPERFRGWVGAVARSTVAVGTGLAGQAVGHARTRRHSSRTDGSDRHSPDRHN